MASVAPMGADWTSWLSTAHRVHDHEGPEVNVGRELAGIGTLVHVPRGDTLVRAGDPWTHVFVVKSGVLVSRVPMSTEHDQVTDFWYPADTIGLGEPHGETATISATVHSVLWRVPRSSLLSLVRDHACFGARLNEIVAANLAAARNHVLLLSCRTAQQRLARFLISIACRPWHRERGRLVWLPMPQADIGDYLGLSAETVCRTFADLRRAGLIGERRRGFVTLLDPMRLAALSGLAKAG